MLHAIWCAACYARSGRGSASAHGIAARVLCHCRKLMFQHWFRVDLRRGQLAACPQWLLSRDPTITLGTFQGGGVGLAPFAVS